MSTLLESGSPIFQPRGPCDRKNSIPIENFNLGSKFSISIEIFNLDRIFQSPSFHLQGPRSVQRRARSKISIHDRSLEIFNPEGRDQIFSIPGPSGSSTRCDFCQGLGAFNPVICMARLGPYFCPRDSEALSEQFGARSLQPLFWGAQNGRPKKHPGTTRFVPISPFSSDDLFRFALLVFGNAPTYWFRFVPICSVFFRFLSICLQKKSEQIRETPFCRPFVQIPILAKFFSETPPSRSTPGGLLTVLFSVKIRTLFCQNPQASNFRGARQKALRKDS